MIETKTMKNIIKVLGIFGTLAIVYASGYFIKLYINFTQLILSLGIAGILILVAFLYIYNWMLIKSGGDSDRDQAIDLTRGYVKDLEEMYA